MRLFIVAFLVCCFMFSGQAQEQDAVEYPTLSHEVLHFHSDFEKAIFTDLEQNSDADFLAFFIASDSTQTEDNYKQIRTRLDAFCTEARDDGVMNKSPKKQLKILYKDVHGTYLDKYAYQNSFAAIFENGEYNCVSGSALYAAIFECLELPYAINEYPTHVNLVAYPKSEQIAVETTDPSGGYLVISDKMKRDYADYLRDNKLISQDEYNQGAEAVFEANYFGSTEINLRQLAGIQYYNNALYSFEKEDYSASLRQSAKAFVLYPTEITVYTLLNAAAYQIETGNLDDADVLNGYAITAQFLGKGMEADYLLAQFEALAGTSLIEKRDTAGFRHVYKTLKANASDSAFKHNLDLYYNYHFARYYALQGDIAHTISPIFKAYELDSSSLEVLVLTKAALVDWLSFGELEQSLHRADSIFEGYPALGKEREIENWYANACLSFFGFCYRDNRISEAEVYRARFEKLASTRASASFGLAPGLFGAAYHEGVVYYFKKGNYKKVNELIASAEKIEPNNWKIKELKRMYR